MANNNIFATESISLNKRKKNSLNLQQLLEAYFKRKLPKDFLLPEKFIEEVVDFMERNSVASLNSYSNGKVLLRTCCLKCCKAYALECARRYNLSKKGVEYLESIFKTDSGHEGFYLDKGNLKRCFS